jgi:hypothetical protein
LSCRDEPRIIVSCATCHHGQARPQTIEDVVRAEMESKGVDSAIQKYREALQHYRESAELDPEDDHVKKRIEELTTETRK